MAYNKIKCIIGVLTVLFAFSGTELDAYAVNIDNILPTAGVEQSLEKDFSLKKTVANGKKTEEQVMTLEKVVTTSVEKNTTEETTTEETTTEKITTEKTPIEEITTPKETKKEENSNLVIAQVNNYVNVRSIPGLDGEVIGKLYDKSVGTFLEEQDGWYKIQSGSCVGYVKAEYCVTGKEANELAKKVGRRTATVNTTTLNVRNEATTDSSILGQVPRKEILTVLEELDGWVKVKIEEGSGYVSKDYVVLGSEFVQAESKEEEKARLEKEEAERQKAKEAARQIAKGTTKQSQNTDVVSTETKQQTFVSNQSLGQQVVDYALQFVGNPYVYGGSSLTNGADCSGFVMSVYANFGVSLPHSSSADRKVGYNAGSLGDAAPGDIVCYSGHVGIYAGNGQIVHASNSRKGIIVSDAGYDTVLAVRRIF